MARKKTTSEPKAGADTAKTGQNSTTAKAQIVEQIVRSLYDIPGYKIETRKRLKTTYGGIAEIDVLLSNDDVVPIRIAIECKNYNKQIGVDEVREFKGKLRDVNIPAQHAIFVTSNGYTKGALDSLKQDGIKPLLLQNGFDGEQVFDAVKSAIQSHIYILLDVTSLSFQNNLSTMDAPGFFADKTELMTPGLEYIYKLWSENIIPAKLSEQQVEITLQITPELETNQSHWKRVNEEQILMTISSNYYYRSEGENVKVKDGDKLIINYRCIGYVVIFEGKSNSYKLLNLGEGKIKKYRASATFEGVVPSQTAIVQSEEELQQLLSIDTPIRVNHRILIPRIKFSAFYYPFSQRVAKMLLEDKDSRNLSFEKIEGLDIRTAWEK